MRRLLITVAAIACLAASTASAGSSLQVTATQQFAPWSLGTVRFDAVHDAVWTIDWQPSGEVDLVKLDPATLAIESSTPVAVQGQDFYDLGVGLNRIWVVNFPDDYSDIDDPANYGSVSEYDGNGTFIRTISTYGHGPEGIGFLNGKVWVANHHRDGAGLGGSVVELDPDTGALIARVPVGAVPVFCCGPQELTVADGAVWTGVPNLNAVVRIDPATLTATVIPGGNGGGQFPGGACGDFASDPATHRLWSADAFCRPSAIVRIDSQTGAVTQSFNPGGVGAGLAFGNGALWVSVADNGRGKSGFVVKVDPATGAVIGKVSIGANGPVAFGDGAAFVAGQATGQLVRITG